MEIERLHHLVHYLHEAKLAHTKFEKHHGVDAHWEEFYAEYLRSRLVGETAEQAYTNAAMVRLT